MLRVILNSCLAGRRVFQDLYNVIQQMLKQVQHDLYF